MKFLMSKSIVFCRVLVSTLCLFLILNSCKKETSFDINSDDDTVVIACGMVAQEFEACEKGVALWQAKTGKKAKVVPVPTGSNEKLTLFQQHLAAESPDIDIYPIDVIWPGLLANHLVDLTPYISSELKDQYIPQIIASNTVNGKIVALPLYVQVGLLYYRKDLLEKYNLPVPSSWEELETTSQKIMKEEHTQGNDQLWGFLFQGRAEEGLTCNALEWISSYKGGGQIVEPNGRVSVDNPAAVSIVNRVAGWVGTLSPKGVLNYKQEDARGVFQLGQAIFMRNWPYAWPVLNSEDSSVAGKIGIRQLPRGGKDGKSSGTTGGSNFAVSKYSRHKMDAINLILFLTSAPELKRRALEHGYYPTMTHLYEDPEVLAISPVAGIMLDVLRKGVTPRPAAQTGPKYSQASAIFWNMVHGTLSGKAPAEKTLAKAAKKLNFISKDGTRWYKPKK
jgi:trehalose/maltose transport system substrate-binding protein